LREFCELFFFVLLSGVQVFFFTKTIFLPPPPPPPSTEAKGFYHWRPKLHTIHDVAIVYCTTPFLIVFRSANISASFSTKHLNSLLRFNNQQPK